jgi:hypothetical protein
MPKIVFSKLFYLCLGFLLTANAVQAQDNTSLNPKIVVHIQAQEYTHPIRLLHVYKDYWFSQGPMLEKAATDVLNQEFGQGNALMCDANPNTSNVLIWLRPRMFYNPQMQTYYGKVIASVYSADGKLIANYSTEANKRGFLDNHPEKVLDSVYQSLMKSLVNKMKADTKIQSALNANASLNPCVIINLLPEPKIQFMSF